MCIPSAEVSILIVAIPSSPSVERPKPKKSNFAPGLFLLVSPHAVLLLGYHPLFDWPTRDHPVSKERLVCEGTGLSRPVGGLMKRFQS
jgi:hypothetical protein